MLLDKVRIAGNLFSYFIWNFNLVNKVSFFFVLVQSHCSTVTTFLFCDCSHALRVTSSQALFVVPELFDVHSSLRKV